MLTPLPIALRELRVAARRRGIYRVRFLGALATLGVTIWLYQMARPSVGPSSLGAEIFTATTTLFFWYSLLAGWRATADSLTVEKRDGTLGLLFLTDLSGFDVVSGKLTATGMNCVYALLAALPVMSLPLMLGGVAWDAVWRMALILLNTLFFSLAAGMLASALCRNERRAVAVGLGLVLGVTAGLSPVGWYLCCYVLRIPTSSDIPWLFTYPCPVVHFVRTMAAFFSPVGLGRGPAAGYPEYWVSLATLHALAWLFLGLASWIVPRSWQDLPATAGRERWQRRWHQWSYGDGATRAQLRRELLDVNPFLWLCGGRDRFQRTMVWGFLGLLALAFVYGWAKVGSEWLGEAVAVATVLICGGSLKYWLAGESSRRLIEVKRDGALELLLCTPLKVGEMLQGHSLAMRRLLGGPWLVVLVVYILMFAVALRDLPGGGGEDRVTLTVAFLAALAFLGVDYYALVYVGALQGLTGKSIKAAGSATVARILLLPWALWLLSLPLGALARSILGYDLDPDGVTLVVWWFVLGMAVDFAYGYTAYRKLHQEFRPLAAQRYQTTEKRRWWRLFRS